MDITFRPIDPEIHQHHWPSHCAEPICQSCGAVDHYSADCSLCGIILCEDCVGAQEGWHCWPELEDFEIDMGDLASLMAQIAWVGRLMGQEQRARQQARRYWELTRMPEEEALYV